ncbi:MAG: DUF3820 family protein [Verrucomicrobia bacterium]|nr:DUF3820 family protein [Verrucomicrobiota bacterium]MDA1087080.1 DUF3820 family protein [Verrucomicrobiota bacterium]
MKRPPENEATFENAQGDAGKAHDALRELANYTMPFGKYKGRRLIDLPEAYLIWFSRQGYPKGKLGELMRSAYEIKLNGLERLLDPLRDSPAS